MTPIEPTRTLGALVAEQPARAAVFERLRLDYCCGGTQTLAGACREHGLELDAVQAALETSDAGGIDGGGCGERDWRDGSLGELCAHIVAVHHDGLRAAFPRIEGLLATVVRVHGAGHAELREVQEAFRQLRAELEPHLEREENVLFAACRELELGGAAVDEGLLSEHEREHAATGDALMPLRVLAGGYDPDSALCNTHRALLDELAAFERDLHRHVHEENNILMPLARQIAMDADATRRAAEAADPLPRCCQAWIAEQSRGWTTRRG